MTSHLLLLAFLAGCSVADDPALTPITPITPADPLSWTARLDNEVGAQPSGIAVSPDGDAIVTESLWSCVDGASAGVIRVDQRTGEAARVDWVRGFATSALAGPSGFSALLATSPVSDPWTFGMSFREYADDGLSFRTYEERSVVPTEMSGDPSTLAALRGYRSDTGIAFTRAITADGTAWEVIDGSDAARIPVHVAVAGDAIVGTAYSADGAWTLLRYDDQGNIADVQPFCGAIVATDTAGAAYGVSLATDGTNAIALCRAGAGLEPSWTQTDDLADASWASVAGIAVGAGQIVVTGTQYTTNADWTQTYSVWTRAYDLDGDLLWEQAKTQEDGGSAWAIAAAIGPTGEVYVLGTETDAEGAAPVVLRYR